MPVPGHKIPYRSLSIQRITPCICHEAFTIVRFWKSANSENRRGELSLRDGSSLVLSHKINRYPANLPSRSVAEVLHFRTATLYLSMFHATPAGGFPLRLPLLRIIVVIYFCFILVTCAMIEDPIWIILAIFHIR